MDYSSFNCPQFFSFSSSGNDGPSDDSYFDTVHEDVCSPQYESGGEDAERTIHSGELQESDFEGVFETPKLVRVSESLSKPIHLDTPHGDKTGEYSMDAGSANLKNEEEENIYPVHSRQKTVSRDSRLSRRKHKSWPTKAYNLRFTPSRWQHYQKLMNSKDVEGSAKAALRTPFTHILRQTPKKDSSGNRSIINNHGTPLLRRKTVGFKQSSPFTPRLARESQNVTLKKKKVHFSEDTPVKTPLPAFELKRKLQVTPYADQSFKKSAARRDSSEVETIPTPPSAFSVKTRFMTMKEKYNFSAGKPLHHPSNKQKLSGDSGNLCLPSSSTEKKTVLVGTKNFSTSGNSKSTASNKVVLRNIFKTPHTDSKVFHKHNDTKYIPLKLGNKGKVDKPLKATAPQPFHFKTDERIKNLEKEFPAAKERDFVSMLRHNTPKTEVKRPQITRVQPFNLTAVPKRTWEGEYKSLAQKVEEHSKKSREYKMESSSSGTSFSSMQLCRPHSPKLLTSTRHRPINVVSQQEKEEQEIQEIRSYRFHAQPLNVRILKEPPHLPQVKVKSPTKPMDVELETEKRHWKQMKLSEHDMDKEQPYVFHAREVPKSILKGPVGVKEKQVKRLTQPQSPAFALKLRNGESRHHSHHMDISQQEQYCFKATEMPKNSPFKPKIEKKKPTTIEPFSFSEKDEQRMKLKEKKIQEELEQEKKMREFHARPIPESVLDNKNKAVPHCQKKNITKPKEFTFYTEKVLERSKMRKNLESENTVFVFKAEPPKVLKKAPFKPKKPAKKPLVPSNFQLSTEKRAEDRQKYEARRMKLENEKQEMLRRMQEEEEQKKEEELRILRSQIVHKAQPVRNYKQVVLKPSEKPLTNPLSPEFATQKRIINKTRIENTSSI